MAADKIDDVWDEWQDAVNMTANELDGWLSSEDSQAVGQRENDDESTGHKSGKRIAALLRKQKGELTDDDADHMRKVVGYVHRHRAQRPSGDVTETRWRYSLMNWGHDPLKQ